MTRVVRVIVVAYGDPEHTERCLAALGGAFDVLVVDNSSSPEVERAVIRHGAEYVNPGTNLGFAAGVNVGLDRLLRNDPMDVLLLNPDAEIAPADVRTLARQLHKPGYEDVAAISPRLVNERGAQQVLWPFPSPRRAWLEAVGLGTLQSGPSFAIGAVLLLRWEALEEIGRFDERFFLYAEEADWQRRALGRGWRSQVCEDAEARHVGAGTTRDDAQRERLFHAAHEIYVRKWYGSGGWSVFRAAVITGSVARSLFLRRERRQEAARRALLYARGPMRSVYGR